MRKSNMQAIASVGAMTRPQFRDLPKLDLSGAIDNYRDSRDYAENRVKKQAYVDALNGGNQDEINSAWANYDPQGYANHLEALKQAEIARQTHLEDQNFQRELLREKLQNAMEIAMLKDNDTNTQRNVAAMVEAGYTPQEAWAMVTGGNNPTLDMSNLGKKGQEAYDKAIGAELAQQEASQRQVRKLTPVAQSAISDAIKSTVDGTGLGQIGGLGWTTGQGGRNRENIDRAKRQMNIMIRGALKEVGVGSKELDAAAEAEAYRANLKYNLPIEQQEQILENFTKDYLSGNLHKELAERYGKKPSLKDVLQPEIQEGAIIEDANGNKMILRGGQWQPM